MSARVEQQFVRMPQCDPNSCASLKTTPHNTTFSWNVTWGIYEGINAFETFYIPLIIFIGIPGNVFCCLVLALTKMRKSPCSVYFTALAVSDTGYLLTLLLYWLVHVGYNIIDTHGICQVVLYLMNYFGCFSTWLVVLFTVERYFVIVHPLHKVSTCTVSKARRAVTALSVFPALLYTIIFHIAGVGKNGICSTHSSYHIMETFFTIFEYIIILLIPLMVIGLINIRICRELIKAQEIGANLQQRYSVLPPPVSNSGYLTTFNNGMAVTVDAQGKRKSSLSPRITVRGIREDHRGSTCSRISGSHAAHRDHRVTWMLISISTTFATMNLPYYLYKLRKLVTLLYANLDYGDLEYSLAFFFQNLYYANFAINFFIYNLTSSNFRQSACVLVKRLLRKINCKNRGKKNSGSQNPMSMALRVPSSPAALANLNRRLSAAPEMIGETSPRYSVSGSPSQSPRPHLSLQKSV